MKTKSCISLLLGLVTIFSSCTKEDIPTFDELNVNTVTLESARLRCPFTIVNNLTIENSGVCWGTEANPTINDSVKYVDIVNSVVSAEIDGLAPNMTYYARAFVKTTAGLKYSTQSIITTPTFEVTMQSSILSDTLFATTVAVLVSDMTSTSSTRFDAFVTEKGFVYGLEANPDLTDNVVYNTSILVPTFTSNINGLTAGTTYHVRSFVNTNTGYYFSEDYTFTTLAPDNGPGGL